jgi:hypothetical protein
VGWRFNPLEARGSHGEWTRGGLGYVMPDPARLRSTRGPYPDPAMHPWFQANPVSSDHVLASYAASTPGERAQGMRWYADAHDIAGSIAKGDYARGGGVLAAYSPQTGWAANMMNASKSFMLGRAIGPGEGMITGHMQSVAQQIMDGAPLDKALKSSKTNAFGHLIASGGDEPSDQLGKVVIDRHAMSVAVGRRLSKKDIDKAPVGTDRYYQHIADTYREASARLEKQGVHIAPHQLQAITWLHQQNENQGDDAAGTTGVERGRTVSQANAWTRWGTWATAHGIPTEAGTTALSGSLISDQIELGFRDDHFDPMEPRNFRGEWSKALEGAGGTVIDADQARNRMVVAFGDPATAQHVLTYVPGVGTIRDAPAELGHAADLKAAMDVQHQGSTAVVYWHGYQPPPSIEQALDKTDAGTASARLALFEQHLKTVNPRAHHTVLGHSYGSVVASQAAARHGMRPDDLVLIGSPGTGLKHASQTGIESGHVWAGADSQDPISRLASSLTPDFGGSPVRPSFGAQVFGAEAGRSFPGPVKTAAHTSYFLPTSQALLNIGRIGTGNYQQIKPGWSATTQFAGTIGEQIELAGWRDAWRHEHRGPGGQWESGTGGAAHEARAYEGKFASTRDTFVPDLTPAAGTKALTSSGRPDGSGTADDPIDVRGDLDRAIQLMAGGKHVRLNQLDEVSTLISKVDELATEMKAKTGQMPKWDLGMISVKGTNLFTAQTRGIPRVRMPQLSGPAAPGSPAAAIVGGAGKFADLAEQFRQQLGRDRIPVTDRIVKVAHLRATQTQLTASTVAGIAEAFEHGNPAVKEMMKEPLWVSRDNYVIDGHHRWAAKMVIDAQDGKLGDDTTQEVHQVGMDIGAIIPYANAFAQRMGIAPTDIGNSHLVIEHSIAGQLGIELAGGGWRGAWRHELRGRGGEWMSDRPGGDPDPSGWITASELPPEPEDEHAGPALDAVRGFVSKAAPQVPGLLGGGREAWSGRVDLFTAPEKPGTLAEMSWSGSMSVRTDVAAHIHSALAHPGKPVSDPDAFNVVLHELTHGDIDEDSNYRDGMAAYQDPNTADIEEGFTELGATEHAADFFDAMGIGDRETEMIATDAHGNAVGGEVDPAAAGGIIQDLEESRGYFADLPNDVLARIDKAEDALRDSDTSTAIQMLGQAMVRTSPSNGGRPVLAGALKAVGRLDQESGLKHATMSEYATRLASPDRIADQDSWGHYPAQTAAAQDWTREVARQEFTAGGQSFSQNQVDARAAQLADEVNRVGTERKIAVMADQVVRASGVNPVPGSMEGQYMHHHTPGIMSDNDWLALEDSIRTGWGTSAEAALTSAAGRARASRAALAERMEREGARA